ncbi:hypothetical protein BKA69DRAFT_487380 [Paraphysoderma sedebokerense]|nr:hypothetical protein BKA69DRAFT_487380 [Paraphysoderma sedebokerense]
MLSLCSPDILAIGTTQVAGRVAEDVIEKLDEWFIDWANEKGTPITEDMQKYTFYDYFVNGSWAGIPLVTDYRVMVYNKTTFSRLNLTAPPPVGNWSVPYFQYWTFEKMAEYAEEIARDLGKGKGFKFMSTWDDELKVLTAMFRNYGLGLLDSNRKCGLRGPRAPEAVNLLRRLYIESQAADLTGFWANNEAFTNWTQKPLYPNPVDNPQLCCSDSESMLKDLPGMAIIPRGDVSWLGNVTDIEFAYLPGRTTVRIFFSNNTAVQDV